MFIAFSGLPNRPPSQANSTPELYVPSLYQGGPAPACLSGINCSALDPEAIPPASKV